MSSQYKKGLMILIGGFIALFLLRLLYSSIYPDDRSRNQHMPYASSWSDFEFSGKNYASAKFKAETIRQGGSTSVDQKYEKIGTIKSKTDTFDSDKKAIRILITGHNALIQFEQNSGLKGNRILQLGIGVLPEKFDAMIAEVKKIGKIFFIQINKTDKTNEYKNLRAKKLSLEKTRNALIALKKKAGKIEEYMALESKILQIEEEIQSFGVKLGEYDEENEFCTLKFTLQEAKRIKAPFIKRVKESFEWTVKYYLGLIGIVLLGSLLILTVLVVFEKVKLLNKALQKLPNAE